MGAMKSFLPFSSPIYRRLLSYVWPHKYKFALGILGGALYSGIDAYFTHLMKPVLDEGFIHKDPHFITILPFLILGIFLLRGLGNFVGEYFMSQVGRNIVFELRNQLFRKLTRMPAIFYDKNTSGQLLSKIIYNVGQVAEATTNAMTIAVQSTVLILGLLVVMLVINWRLTLLYLVALPTIAVIVRFSSQYMRKISLRFQESLGDLTHVSEEMMEGYREVRMFGGEAYENEKFQKFNRFNRNQGMKVVVSKTLSSSFVQIVGAAVLATALYLATCNPLVAADVTPGSLVALLFAMVMLLKPLKDFTNVNNIIQQGIAGAQSVFELLDKPSENDRGQFTLEAIRGKIEFKQVNFTYAYSKKPTLSHIQFTIEPGETVALVGRSGSGKSTLINLIPRFYEIQSGQILIDDRDIADLKLDNLRQHIALVSQRVVLFNDTILHNVAYGALKQAPKEKIWEAIDKAHAREFIEKLPEGLETLVGDNGVLLSGGQRQRLAIARAILKNAPILILDEATSSLDSHAERYIQAALEDLMKNRTTLVIAHRLSTIENADKIMVMENGRIVEIGSHAELLSKSSHYAELYQSQFRHESN